MKKFFNKFFRKDLDLNKKWRHRLFKVLFFIAIAVSFIISALFSRESNKPWHGNYYEIIGSLSDYIEQYNNKSLVSLEILLGDNSSVVNKKIFENEYNIGDIIERPYTSYGPYWLISNEYSDIDRLESMQCKEGLTIDDVVKYKSSHYNSEYYSRASSKCIKFPKDNLLFTQDIESNLNTESNCILTDNNCMITVGKHSGFMSNFVVISKTKNAIKYGNKIYNKEVLGAITKTILITIGVTLGIMAILLLIYYKGFIYVVYGGNNKKK